MKKFLFAFLTASSFNVICPAYAQTVEQRLVDCIVQSQGILTYANAWRESVEKVGETARPSEFADLLFGTTKSDSLMQTITPMLENKESHADISEQLALINDQIDLRIGLVEEMVTESFKDRRNYEAMAEFISQCSQNFGGEVYTLQEEVETLTEDLAAALLKNIRDKDVFEASIRILEAQNQKLIEENAKLTELELYIKRADTLCIWMKTYNHLDVLEKQVFLYGKKYDLCD